jgi:hypothetical protein
MASQLVFACCANPSVGDWKLGPEAGEGTLLLIGCRLAGCDRETTLHYAASVLARALTFSARVTFPSSIVVPGAPREWRLGSVGMIRSLDAGMLLVSTLRDTVCAELFEDPVYPWSMRRHAAVLSPWDAPAPDLDRGDVLNLMSDAWLACAHALWARGVTGVLRPALGGDGAAILWRSQNACESFMNAMAGEGQRTAVRWMPLAEDEFASWAT